MPEPQRGKILRIHLSEHDRHNGRPLYQVIVERCRELKIAGATVFKGLEGYGGTAEIHRPHLLGHDQPIIVVIVDSSEQVSRLIPALDALLPTGLMAISDVEWIRVQRAAGGSAPANRIS